MDELREAGTEAGGAMAQLLENILEALLVLETDRKVFTLTSSRRWFKVFKRKISKVS